VTTDEKSKVTGIDMFFCKGCGICAAVCPAKAIEMRHESEFIKEGHNGDERRENGANPGEAGGFVGS
jgi:pyruvate ferredoxin oxidoreductase delta subunit